MTPAVYAEDRSIRVPSGKIVRTGYVDVFKVRLACRERMAVGDVAAAYQKRLQLGSDQSWPCPNGYWDGETFVLQDGRHEWVSSVMLGLSHVLVAWLESYSESYDQARSLYDKCGETPANH
jgi:hypothetical protein